MSGISTRFVDPTDSDDDDRAIRIGREYQATVPKAVAYPAASEYKPPPKLANPRLVWSPSKCSLSDAEVNTFVQNALASVTHALQVDQVLGILHWNEYNVTAAMADVQKYCCHPDTTTDWTKEECALFERAFEKYRKNFRKIANVFPSRNTRSIVRYYYHWKKTRRTDKKVQSLALEEPSRPTLDDVSDDEDIDMQAQSRRGRRTGRGYDGPATCSNCGAHADEEDEDAAAAAAAATAAAAAAGSASGAGAGATAEDIFAAAAQKAAAAVTTATAVAAAAASKSSISNAWRLRQVDCAHLCKSCAAFWKMWGRDKPIKVHNGHNGYRPNKRPKLDFGEPATEVSLRVTLPMTTGLLGAELARLQAPPVDSSYLSRRQQQLDVEAELLRYNVDVRPSFVALANSNSDSTTHGVAQDGRDGAGAAAEGVAAGSSGIVASLADERNGWTSAIIATIADGLAIHGKNFHRISRDMLKGIKTADELRILFKERNGAYGFDDKVKIYFDRLRGIGIRAAGNLGIKAEPEIQTEVANGTSSSSPAALIAA